MNTPLSENAVADAGDQTLIERIRDGSQEALAALIKCHQPWIYNIARRMLYLPEDAEDATQEILIKVITKVCTFDGRSSFRTWLYRIAVNHLLNMKRGRAEEAMSGGFAEYGRALDNTPDLDFSDPKATPVQAQLLFSEAMLGCTSGMLLCLDREQRLVYILGAIFGVTDKIGAEVLEVSRENFRQKLARARRDLHNFMQEKCGLVNRANPCRCAKKTLGFIQQGYMDAERLIFAREHVTQVKQVAEQALATLETLDAEYADVYRSHPFHDSPDFIADLKKLMATPAFKSILEPDA